MGIPITLADISNAQQITSAATALNSNSSILESALEGVLSTETTSIDNAMNTNLDMNGNQILNLPAPATLNSPARLQDVASNPTISVPPVGTSGGTVPLLNANNTWSGLNTYNLGSDVTGDMYYRSSGGPTARLGIGTTSQVLTVAAGLPSWKAVPFPLMPASFISLGVFVSSTGNDSTGTGASGSPWLTIQHAMDQILSYDFGGAFTVVVHVGAGSFAGWTVIGPARGWTGDQSTGVSTTINVVGAGSGSTNINHLVGDTSLCIGPSAGIFTAIQALNVNVPGSNGNGANVNTGAVMGLGTDVTFTGTGDGTGTALVCDAFGFVVNGGAVTLKGTLDTYFVGTNTANYESFGTLTIKGALGTFANLSVLSNMHGETVSLGAGGSTTSFAYFVDANSVLSMSNSLVPEIWSTGGILTNGGRSEGACDSPAVTSSTGLGTGSAGTIDTGTAYANVIKLSPTGSPSSTGNVVFNINETPTINFSTGPFTIGLQGGTGAWNTRAAATITSVTFNSAILTITIHWDNNSVSLTAGSTYFINLIGQT